MPASGAKLAESVISPLTAGKSRQIKKTLVSFRAISSWLATLVAMPRPLPPPALLVAYADSR